MVWYQVLGWLTFWIGLIIAIVLFSSSKKIYPVFYLASICLYIFTMGFAIDVFEFGKTARLATFVFTALLFMFLGYYLSKVLIHHEK